MRFKLTNDSQAIFEAQEETITHLKIQLRSKEQSIESLEQKLKTALQEKDAMQKAMRYERWNCFFFFIFYECVRNGFSFFFSGTA